MSLIAIALVENISYNIISIIVFIKEVLFLVQEIHEIYLDNSATTKPCAEAVAAANEMMLRCWVNPSSTHRKGNEAALKLREARHSLALAISAAPEEIFFTSGGTEANNIAVFGAAIRNRRAGNRIVTTAIEHSSVIDSVAELEKQGFEVIRLKPDRYGHISPDDIAEAVNSDTILFTMMMVNNEVGSILPVEAAVKTVRKKAPRAIVHCDCVQAFGKIPVSVKKLGADMVIAAFGAAANIACDRKNLSERFSKVTELRDYTIKRLSEIDGIVINSPDDALPYIVNFSTCCVKAETMLNFLSERGIYVSGGSACAKGEPSHVIKALGLPRDAADSAIRVSFCADNTSDQIDALAGAVAKGISSLAHFA